MSVSLVKATPASMPQRRVSEDSLPVRLAWVSDSDHPAPLTTRRPQHGCPVGPTCEVCN